MTPDKIPETPNIIPETPNAISKPEEVLYKTIECDACNNKWSRLYLTEVLPNGNIKYIPDSGTLLSKGGDSTCVLTVEDYSKFGPIYTSPIVTSDIVPMAGKPLFRYIGCDTCKNKYSTIFMKEVLPDGTIQYTPEITNLLSWGVHSPCVLSSEDYSNIGPIDSLSIDNIDILSPLAPNNKLTTPSVLLKTHPTIGTITSTLPNLDHDFELIDNNTPAKLMSAYNTTSVPVIETAKSWYSLDNISLPISLIAMVTFVIIVTGLIICCSGERMNGNKEDNPEEGTSMVDFNLSSNPYVV